MNEKKMRRKLISLRDSVATMWRQIEVGLVDDALKTNLSVKRQAQEIRTVLKRARRGAESR